MIELTGKRNMRGEGKGTVGEEERGFRRVEEANDIREWRKNLE